MIEAATVMEALIGHGVTLVSGVPCSYLTPVINQAISDPGVRYLAATQEGEAAAIVAGAWLGGGLGCAIGQNSGLGNMVNPLTSLLHPAFIPALLMVTWRGEPGRKDEPQHQLMGRVTTALLDLMQIPWDLMPPDPALVPRIMESACRHMSTERHPYAIVIQKDTVAPSPLDEVTLPPPTAAVVRSTHPAQRPARATVLRELLATAPADAAIISTTGFTSRELHAIEDRPSNFYLYGRPGLVHVVLDNGQHESTGGQRTASPQADLVAAAAACGYRHAYACSTVDELTDALNAALDSSGPALIHLPIRAGVLSGLGRPTITPAEVAQRFRAFVSAPVAVPAQEVLR